MFSGFGAQELILILVIVLVLFGGKKIPEIMRGLGQGMKEFRQASTKAAEDMKQLAEADEDTDIGEDTA